MVQYHALSLLYSIKKTDKLAVSKLVRGLCEHGALTFSRGYKAKDFRVDVLRKNIDCVLTFRNEFVDVRRLDLETKVATVNSSMLTSTNRASEMLTFGIGVRLLLSRRRSSSRLSPSASSSVTL